MLYLNGQQEATANFSNDAPSVANQIGGQLSSNFGFSNAVIDDVRIYNRALSPQEIRILATRRGIAYEMAPRRRSSSAVQFNRRRRLLLGASN